MINVVESCKRCRNLGILRIQNKAQELDSLVFCSCDWSEEAAQLWQIPRVSKKIEEAFEVSCCPLMWFLPDNERESVPRGTMVSSIEQKALEWRARMLEAKDFWANWAGIFEDKNKHWQDR